MLSQLTKTSKLIVNSTTFRSSLFPINKSFVMNFSTETLKVEHEPLQSRFIINHEGYEAEILYILKGHKIHFTHTEVPEEMGGKGVGKVLTKVLKI